MEHRTRTIHLSDRLKRANSGRLVWGILLLVLTSLLKPNWLVAESGRVPFQRIDSHAHLFSSSPELYAWLRRANLRLLNICVVDKHDRGFEQALPQHTKALEIYRASRGRVAWCSTFDPKEWENPEFADRSINLLDSTFLDGAVAVKIYKSIGMELKSKTGEYLMPDDAVFDPIFELVRSRNKTLFAHLAEPTSCWQPLDPASPDYEYYKANPDWHMFLHPDRPSKESILAARDRLLERHPQLKVVGCHLGSMEVDVSDIAKRFDRYPNFAVDTAARIPYLMTQSRDKVRDFLIQYQDRVLYATDLVWMPWHKTGETLRRWQDEYARDWRFFATDETIIYRDRKIQGLALPKPVLQKLFYDNAIRWVPGVVKSR